MFSVLLGLFHFQVFLVLFFPFVFQVPIKRHYYKMLIFVKSHNTHIAQIGLFTEYTYAVVVSIYSYLEK